MKKIVLLCSMAVIMMSCSSPQNIILKDGRIIETKDDPTFNRKTNYFEYVDSEGKKGSVNAEMVELIQPVDAEIPKPAPMPEGEKESPEEAGEAAPAGNEKETPPEEKENQEM